MSLDVSAGGAFVAGVLSFVSPCVLPLVPPYLAYMGGVSISELRDNEGATASFIGQAVGAYLGYLGYAAGILIIVMGLHFLGIFRIALLDAARASASRKSRPVLPALMSSGRRSDSAGAGASGRC